MFLLSRTGTPARPYMGHIEEGGREGRSPANRSRSLVKWIGNVE